MKPPEPWMGYRDIDKKLENTEDNFGDNPMPGD
jgi:hypothetical protein